MPKDQPPEYYRAPLKSRAAIAEFLIAQRSYNRVPPDYCRFVWNVKCYDLDFSYENLLRRFEEDAHAADMKILRHPAVEALVRRRLDRVEESNRLWEHAVNGAWEEIHGTDTYNHLWDGTPLSVKYASFGRSGGYIGLVKFDGWDFTQEWNGYWDALFRDPETDYQTLRRLYQLVVMLNHDFTPAEAKEQLEYHATDYLFCDVVEKYEAQYRAALAREIHTATGSRA